MSGSYHCRVILWRPNGYDPVHAGWWKSEHNERNDITGLSPGGAIGPARPVCRGA